MSDRRGRATWGLLFSVVVASILLAGFAGLAGCGSSEPPLLGDQPAFDAGALSDVRITVPCGPGVQGCACSTPGQKTACGKVVDKNGSYVTCSEGYSTCTGGEWGACAGDTIVAKSLPGHTLKADGIHVESVTTACTNVCDPNPDCTTITGQPTADLPDASGLTVTDAGVYIAGGEGGTAPCTGLSCDVTKCMGTPTSISGVVNDPAGRNAVYNATVFVPNDPNGTVPALTQGASCDTCVSSVPQDAVAVTTTAADGSFTLNGIPNGTDIPVVVQVGKWRREVMLTAINPCTGNTITDNCTSTDPTMCTFNLPRNQYDGYNSGQSPTGVGTYDYADMPEMAFVAGSWDPLACVLLKAGVDPSEFSSYDGKACSVETTGTCPAADVVTRPGKKIHYYAVPAAQNLSYPGYEITTLLDSLYGNNFSGQPLWTSGTDPTPSSPTPPHYDYYDAVFFTCTGQETDWQAQLGNPSTNVYKTLINFTDNGGRLFTTHHGDVWLDLPHTYPAVPSADNWSNVATWGAIAGDQFIPVGQIDGTANANIVQTFAKGAAFAQWLKNTGASTTLGVIPLTAAREDLSAVGPNSTAWMSMASTLHSGTFPPHFTYNTPYNNASASQCGRVTFSDFHAAVTALVGGGSTTTPSNKCLDNYDCGYTETCYGATGGTGTCSEPCTSSADCADTTYSCVGATPGACSPNACTATTSYTCAEGACSADTMGAPCECTDNSQCPSNNTTQAVKGCTTSGPACSGSCTGSGTADSFGCVPVQTTLPAACSNTTTHTCAVGTCDTAGTQCVCTDDSQCASKQCFNTTSCGGTCSGSNSNLDAANCVNPPSNTCTSASSSACSGAGACVAPAASGATCTCTADGQCASGVCIRTSACTGTCSGAVGDPQDPDGPINCTATTEPAAVSTPSCTAANTVISGSACVCASDAACPSHRCVPVAGQNVGAGECSTSSSTPCSGMVGAATDAMDCVPFAEPSTPTAATPGVCAEGDCEGVTPPSATCAASGAPCWCTANSQCESQACASWAGCSSGACTTLAGGQTTDSFNCIIESPGLPATPVTQGGPGHYYCSTTLTPQPVPASSTASAACLCVDDSDCPSGACANAGHQCTTGTCSGTITAGTYDAADCQIVDSSVATYSCAAGGCDGTSGGCTVSSTGCYCRSDADCQLEGASGKCVKVTNQNDIACGSTGCSGNGAQPFDSFDCQLGLTGQIPSAPTMTTTSACSKGNCSGGACSAAGHQCICTDNSQCPSKLCVNPSTCAGTCSGSGTNVDGFGCELVSPGIPPLTATNAYTCSAGGCDAASGACSAAGDCYCYRDSQCESGHCAYVTTGTDANSTACGSATNCSGGTNPASSSIDGFDCLIEAPGIPASCTAGFGYTPSNFTATTYQSDVPTSATTLTSTSACTYVSGTGTWTCPGVTAPYIAKGQTQTSGPAVDILVFESLTIPSGASLTLTGANPVILAVYGNATISGTINASSQASSTALSGMVKVTNGSPNITFSTKQTLAAGAPLIFASQTGATYHLQLAVSNSTAGQLTNNYAGTSASATTATEPGTPTPGPGGDSSYCGNGTAGSGGNNGASGGGGGGMVVAGGTGSCGGQNCSSTPTMAGGAAISATGLVGGCAGGVGEGDFGTMGTPTTPAGAGGGAVQISAAGAISGTGSITANGTPGINGLTGQNGSGGGGGGSGGAILLEGSQTMTPSITLAANGGAGGAATGTGGTAGTNNGTTKVGPGAAQLEDAINECGGGGGGSYGVASINAKTASGYTCTTSLPKTPTCNTAHTACQCVDNSDCSSGLCSPVVTGQCPTGNTCTGSTTSGAYDANYCEILPVSTTTSYSCTTSLADAPVPYAAGSTCLCSDNSDCGSGLCASVSGENSTQCAASGHTCSGSSSNPMDAENCNTISSTSSTTTTCSTTLSPAPAYSSTNSECVCTSNADCQSGLCSPVAGQCGANPCGGSTASGSYDPTTYCAIDKPGASVFECSKGNCDTVTTSSGSCTAAGTPCWCTKDSDCNVTGDTKGQCVSWDGCASGACSGSGTSFDGFHCALTSSGIPPTSTDAPAATCSPGTPSANDAHCLCTQDSQCGESPYGKCVPVTTGNNANSAQCTSCSGMGTPDPATDCLEITSGAGATTYSCSPGALESDTQCVCTDDSQCASNVCVNASTCTGTCSSTLPPGDTLEANGCAAYKFPAPTSIASCTNGGFMTSSGACLCTANAQCSSGECVNDSVQDQCNGFGPCVSLPTGATVDSTNCVDNPPADTCTVTTTYACSPGVCNAAKDGCLCTANGQCPSEHCVDSGQGCTGTCDGSGTPDSFGCMPFTEPQACTTNTTYACTTGTCDTATGACLCTNNDQCLSDQCVPNAFCNSPDCTGTGTPDSSGCVPQATPPTCVAAATSYCAEGWCNTAAGGSGLCQCTADSQCPTDQCVNNANCAAGACTGTGPADNAGCQLPANNSPASCYTSNDCGALELCGGVPTLGNCSKACTSSSNCTGGETCSGGYCAACTSSSHCSDRAYPATCNVTTAGAYGKCCYGETHPDLPSPPNALSSVNSSSCAMNPTLFPEACSQAPMTAQEKALEFMIFDVTSCVQNDLSTADAGAGSGTTLSPVTFYLDFASSCPSGTYVKWREFDYQVSFPNPVDGSSIVFSAQTGNTAPDGGGLLPATPLPLATADSDTALPNWDDVLLDTSPVQTPMPDAGGLFNNASPALVSGPDLRIWVTIDPTTGGASSPTLLQWRATYDCPASE